MSTKPQNGCKNTI